VASAYEFCCDMSMDEMLKILNSKGSWSWSIHDSHWYGDYLVCRPEQGVRVRIHHPSEAIAPDTLHSKNYYTATFSVDSGAAAALDSIDQTLRKLLSNLGAQNVHEVEYYD
jgi:hypothetical protein